MKDATSNQAAKMSPSFKRLVKTFDWIDSFRQLHPSISQHSRYYSNIKADGASRIDRSYHYGNIKVLKANYIPLAFSDHHGHIVEIQLPDSLSRSVCPKSNSFFRIKSEVVLDLKFQSHLKEAMAVWTEIRSFGLDVLTW